MTEAEALGTLARMVAAAAFPPLTSDDLLDLLAGARVADGDNYAPDALRPWTPNTPVGVDTLAVPSVRNGYYYTVTTAGTTGDTEPTWPTTAGATVTDGTAVWTKTGAAYWTPTWDLEAAAVAGWQRKAGLAASAVNVSDNGQGLSRSDIIKNCLLMAAQYRRGTVGSIPTGYQADPRASVPTV